MAGHLTRRIISSVPKIVVVNGNVSVENDNDNARQRARFDILSQQQWIVFFVWFFGFVRARFSFTPSNWFATGKKHCTKMLKTRKENKRAYRYLYV